MTIYDRVLSGDLPIPECSKTLGFQIIDYCPRTRILSATFSARKAFTNPMGHVQGGFLCAMLDDVMGPALVFSLQEGQFAPTLELKTQFLRPAKPGRIEGRGMVVSKGRTVAYLEGELHQQETLIAKATATALMTDLS